jgi:hypothetical protein
MTRFGVGPLWLALSAVLTATMLLLTSGDPDAWAIPWLGDSLRQALGAG